MNIKLFGQDVCVEDISYLGVQDIAFSPSQADNVLDILRDNKVLILGGDILVESEGRMKFSYENWYSESEDYLETYNTAKKYLTDCKKRHVGQKYLVIIVF